MKLVDLMHAHYSQVNADGLIVQNTTPQERFKHLMALPIQVQVSAFLFLCCGYTSHHNKNCADKPLPSAIP